MPLGLERQAYSASRSSGIFQYEAELTAMVEAGVRADEYHLTRRRGLSPGIFSDTPVDDRDVFSVAPCISMDNCTLPHARLLIMSMRQQQMYKYAAVDNDGLGDQDRFDHVIPKEVIKSNTNDKAYNNKGEVIPPEDLPVLAIPVEWAVQLLKEESNSKLDPGRLSTLLFLVPDRKKQSRVEQTAAFISAVVARNIKESGGVKNALSEFTFQSSSPPSLMEEIRDKYLKKVAANYPDPHVPAPAPQMILPRLYRNLQKHLGELRRMQDVEHKTLVPLVEAALAIMRLSCERWFALLGVYLCYILFRDPPPAARAVVRFVARLSRVFQRAILLSFPGVCWIYGAGFLFSTFASVIFWAGPVLRGLEHLRSATASVMPRDWHDATPGEIERMGGVCAICWGELDAPNDENAGVAARSASGLALDASNRAQGDGGAPFESTASSGGHTLAQRQGIAPPAPAAGVPEHYAHHQPRVHAAAAARDLSGGSVEGVGGLDGLEGDVHGMRGAGLACGHAYHRHCLIDWLQSCYA